MSTITPDQALEALRDAIVSASGLADTKVLIAPYDGPRPVLPYASIEWISFTAPLVLKQELTDVEMGTAFRRDTVNRFDGTVRVRFYSATPETLAQTTLVNLEAETAILALQVAMPSLAIWDVGDVERLVIPRELGHEVVVWCDLQLSWISDKTESIGRIHRVIGKLNDTDFVDVSEGD